MMDQSQAEGWGGDFHTDPGVYVKKSLTPTSSLGVSEYPATYFLELQFVLG